MELLEDESVIIRSDSNDVTLTTHRIRYQSKASGSYFLTSIMLDQVCSIEVAYKSRPLLLALSIICAAAATIMMNQMSGPAMYSLFVIAVILFVSFLSSRKHLITIASGSAKISFHTKGIKDANVLNFVTRLEEARTNFQRRLTYG